MWDIREQPVPSGIRIEVFREDIQLSFRELFFLLKSNAEFACWYSEILAGCDFEAFFLEFPPLTTTTFESQFLLQRDSDVIIFPNLGGDALLIVPIQLDSIEFYPHLATFLRNAPRDQIRIFWKVAGDAVHESLSRTPRWLSTAGLGVSWLHLRLDTRPKYYSFSPYKPAV